MASSSSEAQLVKVRRFFVVVIIVIVMVRSRSKQVKGRVGEITGTKMAEYRVNTGYLPYGNFYVEMYQIMTSYRATCTFLKWREIVRVFHLLQ